MEIKFLTPRGRNSNLRTGLEDGIPLALVVSGTRGDFEFGPSVFPAAVRTRSEIAERCVL